MAHSRSIIRSRRASVWSVSRWSEVVSEMVTAAGWPDRAQRVEGSQKRYSEGEVPVSSGLRADVVSVGVAPMTSLKSHDQVQPCFPSSPRLVVLRGNSASGKSTVAQTLRTVYGRGLAIIPQDVVRRDILRERDRPGAVNVELIDLMARHSLSHGFHVVLEGIFYVAHYGDMLTRLIRDHPGAAHCYYFDIPFQTTLERHATKPIAKVVGEAELRQWWRPRDLLSGEVEEIIDEHSSLDQTVTRILKDCGLASGGHRA